MKCTILVDGPRISRWKLECIELLQRGNDVEVRILGLGERRDRTARRLLGGATLARLPVSTQPGSPAACDLVLDLRTNVVPEPATFGHATHWFFCEADGSMLGELPGAREIAAGSPTFTIELRSSVKSGGFTTLRAGTFKSLYTYARSLDVALEECKRWPALSLTARSALRRLPLNRQPAPRQGRPAPSLLRLMLRVARAFVAHAYVHLFVDAQWNVGLIQGSPASFLRVDYRPNIQWLPQSPSEFLADPFVLRARDRRYVLGERLDRATRNGFITCLEIEKGGELRAERTVMRSDTHLSYPYVFAHDGVWYMVPESCQERRVTLFRGLDVPYTWERVATLLEDVAACDNTIVRFGELWWLFCTHKSRDANLNLFLYYARDLFGPWRAHIANPVKTDIRSARPAGTPFLANGVLYRPAQDCARAYGDAITFNRVTTLTEFEFVEEPVAVFRRDETLKRCHGMHTLSHSDGVMAIDSKTLVFASPRVIRRRLGELATRIASRAS